MLKKVETLLLEGCNLGESRIEIIDMNSTEMPKVNHIVISTITSSSTVLKAIPSYSKFVFSLPRTLVGLSLKNNNLSTESFPMDFSCLSMLKELYLDGNPIVSLPNCVRSLPRLVTLSMDNCNILTSVENPPHTLTHLNLIIDYNNLRKVVFDPQMSPLQLRLIYNTLPPSSFEIEGMVKIQPIAGVEEKLLRSLGWTKLDFLYGMPVAASSSYYGGDLKESEIQMYYEFGIFSTIYVGVVLPDWIAERSTRSSMSFAIPSSPNRLRGLNFCYVLTSPYLVSEFPHLWVPWIIIRNITKNCTWEYHHHIQLVDVGGNCMTLLSHWMFGMNEMECGDHVTITFQGFSVVDDIDSNSDTDSEVDTTECGVSFVYDDRDTNEEDVLGYYKSWNHIIGGDLTAFQSTTGKYILSKQQILHYIFEVRCHSYVLFFI